MVWAWSSGKASSSPSLNFSASALVSSTWPRIARIQPRFERITVIGSRSIIASSGMSRAGAASSIRVRRRPSAVSGPYFARKRGEVLLEPGALAGGRFDQLAQALALLDEVVALALELHLLEPAQATAAAC